MSSILDVNTKLEAFKLINDPTKLLSLLYSKYGDIKEDFYSSFINQILYDKNSKFNLYYKEIEFNENFEYLKRKYNLNESLNRMPKLYEYYKNYHLFFCKPILNQFNFIFLLKKYYEKKAEIFYNANYGDDEINKENNKNNKNNKNNNNSDDEESSLSSLDNITNNKTIFDKKTKLLIDKPSNKGTITLTLSTSRNNNNNNNNLISKRSKDNSFLNIVSEIINYKKQNENKNKNNINKTINYKTKIQKI